MSKLRRLLTTALLILMGTGIMSTGARANDPAIIAPDDALALMKKGELVLIDVRTPDEWKQTGVPSGAATIDLMAGADEFVLDVLRLVGGNHDRPVAVICRSGNRSNAARSLLMGEGFTQVLDVREGVLGGSHGPGWKARGLPMQAPGG